MHIYELKNSMDGKVLLSWFALLSRITTILNCIWSTKSSTLLLYVLHFTIASSIKHCRLRPYAACPSSLNRLNLVEGRLDRRLEECWGAGEKPGLRGEAGEKSVVLLPVDVVLQHTSHGLLRK